MGKTIADFVHLTDIQKRVLSLFDRHEIFYKNFYFTGGTLLKALGIVPRESNDLDFFTFHTVEQESFPRILNAIKKILEKELGADSLENALIGTMPEEKLFQELLAKKKLFHIKPQLFIFDGKKNARLAADQVDFLLHSTTL